MRPVRVCLLLTFALVLPSAPASASGWLAPVTLSDAGQHADEPQVAVDADGDAVAVWLRSDGSHARIQAATRPAGGAWTTPVTLSDAGQNADDPQVAVDTDGDAVAIWRRSDGTNIRVQAAARPAGGAWTAPTTISAAGPDTYDAGVAVDPDGDAVAVWTQSDGSNIRVQAATRPAGGAWTAPDTLSTAGRDATAPQVGVDADGDAVAVWRRSDGSNVRAQAATRPAGGTWAAPDTISDAGQTASEPQVAVGADGTATAAWRANDGGDQYVKAATRPAGGAWTTPATLSNPAQTADRPQVAVDATGDTTAVWRQTGGGYYRVTAATRPAGGSWSAADTLSDAGQHAYLPQVAVDPDGDATAVWHRTDGSHNRVQAATRPAGGAWATPVMLSAAGQHASGQQIAVDAGGDATAVWHRSDGTNTRVQSAVFDATAPSVSATLPTTASTGEPVAFSASISDTWSAVSASWTFGDGASSSATSTNHTYAAPGTYTVTVTATDAVGNTRAVTGQITVTTPSPSTGGAPSGTPPPGTGGTTPDTARRAPIRLPSSLLTFPPSRGCVSTATVNVGLTPRAGITYRRARIELTAGKRTVTRTVTPRTVGAKGRKRIVIPVRLTGLPKGSLRLTITVTTRGDHVLTARRTLRTCAAKAGKHRGR